MALLNTLGLTSKPKSFGEMYSKIGSSYSFSSDKFLYYVNSPLFFNVSIKNIKPIPDIVTDNSDKEDKSFLSTVGDKISNVAKDFSKNILGFDVNKDNYPEELRKYVEGNNNSYTKSFLYKATELLRIDLDSDFSTFVQDIELPSIDLQTDTANNNWYDEPIFKDCYACDVSKHSLTMKILDMVAPIHEYVFYPWIIECGNNFWTYSTQPFSTCDIEISFMFPAHPGGPTEESLTGALDDPIGALNNAMGGALDPTYNPTYKYIFKDCYPTNMELNQPSNEQRTSFTRKVEFTFRDLLIQVSGTIQTNVLQQLGQLVANRIAAPAIKVVGDAVNTAIVNPIKNKINAVVGNAVNIPLKAAGQLNSKFQGQNNGTNQTIGIPERSKELSEKISSIENR